MVVVDGLDVRPGQMAANLAAANLGDDVGEAPALASAALKQWRAGR
jgi:hypothetical protein